MKTPFPLETPNRFSGRLRHYHRVGGQKQRTWEEWVDGAPTAGVSAKPARGIPWRMIAVVIAAGSALMSIVVGLIVAFG